MPSNSPAYTQNHTTNAYASSSRSTTTTLRREVSKRVNVNCSNPLNYAEYIPQGEGLDSLARCDPDGRISLIFDFKSGPPDIPHQDHAKDVEEFAIDRNRWSDCPKMNIVIMIVGSRGDVQPYVALGKQLLKDGHRVRIATHETFRQFVGDAGLEFFNIGGNPQDLMSYMVKNPGLMPGFDSLKNGDITKKRKMLTEMIHGCWNSCHSPCPISGRAFAADAIVSNPPAFAHIHCAEALGIPLLLSFTMPWSPTVAFGHPLVNVMSNAASGVRNYLSYLAADLLTWQGIGDIINKFRTSKLGLSPLNVWSGPGYVDRLKVPWTYCMSPALVPKPDDWKTHIDVTGFYFLDLAHSYQPPPELTAFLRRGETPVYIGFGSVVVDDPAALTQIIFDATEQAGVRALVSAGWGGLGGTSIPPHVFMLGNIPHDWLFDKGRVSAVVHHGGAGTTAIGLAKGRPTVVVPFFGDQAFWGSMIHKAGAGPEPIPYKELSVTRLHHALKYAISPESRRAAAQMAQKIHEENGLRRGVDSFYRHLPLLNMRCDLEPSRLAVWWSKENSLKLSAFAAQILADAKLISLRDLHLHRPKEYRSRKLKEPEPLIGRVEALFWSLAHQAKIDGLLHSAAAHLNSNVEEEHASVPSILDAINSIHAGLRVQGDSPQIASGSGRSPMRKETGDTLDSVDSSISKKEATKKEKIIEAIKLLISPKRATNLGLTTITIQNNRQRMTRIAEGRQSVRSSTESQRVHVLERFRAKTTPTTVEERRLYRKSIFDAWKAARGMSTDSEMDTRATLRQISESRGVGSTTFEQPNSGPSRDMNHSAAIPSFASLIHEEPEDEEETGVFLQEMDMAIKLSLQDYGPNYAWTPNN